MKYGHTEAREYAHAAQDSGNESGKDNFEQVWWDVRGEMMRMEKEWI